MKSAPRMALQYILLFGASGATLPFAGLWFRDQGLSGAQIGALLAIPMLARAMTGPLLAVWAGGFTLRRTPMALLGLVMLLSLGRAIQLMNDRHGPHVRGVAAGVGMGLICALLHASVDLNLQINANAMALTVLLAVVWTVPRGQSVPESRRR